MKNLIKFFHAAPTNGKKVDVMKVASEAAKRGYIVHPDCCTQEVLDFVQSETYNPNSTFYKTWAEITDKTRWELLIDQLLHYVSTYGTNYEGNVYCPNGEPIEVNYKTYTVIEAVTPREFYDRCVGLLVSGIALSKETLESLISYVVDSVKSNRYPLDLDSIANRDAQAVISNKLGLYPTTGDAIIRVLFYQIFGNPMPIQGHKELNALHGRKNKRYSWSSSNPTADVSGIDLTKLTTEQLEALASVFLRYKKFLLGLKHNKKNAPVINKLRRMAKIYHKPFKVGFWESFTSLSDKEVNERLEKEVAKLDNNFKITRLIQMIVLRKVQNSSCSERTFVVRNGKVWRDRNSLTPYNPSWDKVLQVLIEKLISNIANKRLIEYGSNPYIKFPENLELTCPVSEKKFLGNVPFGSQYNMAAQDNYFGVYWRNEWGTHDFDLSFINDSGQKIGWNSEYYNEGKNVVFSGDMTNAEPEATEMFYVNGQKPVPDGLLILNRFNGEADSKYRIFLGQEKIGSKFGRNYMVDPNTIQFSEMGESTTKEQIVGRIYKGKFIPCVFDIANTAVSAYSRETQASFRDLCMSYLPLKPILLEAGFKEWTPELKAERIEPVIDLNDLKKDTLINLFT